MADKKISALPASTTPLAGTEVLPIVQGGATVQVSAANITAGRAVTALSATTTGGLKNISSGSDSESPTQGLFFTDAANKNVIVQLGASGGLSSFVYEAGGAGWRRVAGLLTNGNSVVDVGNLVIGTAGKGIDFSANTGTAGMTSELLNWYEEGTFTPTFTGLTVGNGSVFGYYRRIGKQVFLTYGFILGSTSAVAALTGVSGLPFTTGTVGGNRFFPVTGTAFESGVGWYGATSTLFSASTTGIGVFSPTNNVGFSAAVPFLWGTDDSLSLTANYFVD
jgi:hypothetical protein